MRIKTQTFGSKDYKVANGTYYNVETEDSMIQTLENIRLSESRMRFSWGDAKTGRDWCEIHDVTGRISRSMGPVKVPILIFNRRSYGGGAILTHCIVRIVESRGGRVIYEHPKYHRNPECGSTEN